MIKKYNQHIKESLLDNLTGPSKEEVWNSIGKDFFEIETPPNTIEDFLNYVFEISKPEIEKVIDFDMWRVKYKERAMFFIVTHVKILYIYDKVFTIMDEFYNIHSKEKIYKLIKEKLYELFGDFNIESYDMNILDD